MFVAICLLIEHLIQRNEIRDYNDGCFIDGFVDRCQINPRKSRRANYCDIGIPCSISFKRRPGDTGKRLDSKYQFYSGDPSYYPRDGPSKTATSGQSDCYYSTDRYYSGDPDTNYLFASYDSIASGRRKHQLLIRDKNNHKMDQIFDGKRHRNGNPHHAFIVDLGFYYD